MMYYKIQPAFINKVVGYVASDHMTSGYTPQRDNSVVNLKVRGRLDFTPDINAFQILKRAKPMDIITSIPVGGGGIIVSDKLLDVILKNSVPIDTQFFKAFASFKNEIFKYNYFYIYQSNEGRIVDWHESRFIETKFGQPIGNELKLSLDDILNVKANSVKFRHFSPTNLVLINNLINSDIFRLDYSYSGYYVTEKLKQEIENSNCKGVDLIPIDQLGFVVAFV